MKSGKFREYYHHVWVDSRAIVWAHFVVSAAAFESADDRGIGVEGNWVETTSWEVGSDWAQNHEALGFSGWLEIKFHAFDNEISTDRNTKRRLGTNHCWADVKRGLLIIWNPITVNINQLSNAFKHFGLKFLISALEKLYYLVKIGKSWANSRSLHTLHVFVGSEHTNLTIISSIGLHTLEKFDCIVKGGWGWVLKIGVKLSNQYKSIILIIDTKFHFKEILKFYWYHTKFKSPNSVM